MPTPTRDALIRIENMVQMGNMGLPSKAIRQQIVGAIDLIVQVERQRDGGRRITQVTEVCGMEGEIITMNDIFQFEILGEGPDGKLFGHYKVSKVPPSFLRAAVVFRAGPAVEGGAGGGRDDAQKAACNGFCWSCPASRWRALVSAASWYRAHRTIGKSATPGWRWSLRHICGPRRLEISAFTRASKPQRSVGLTGMAAWVFGFDAASPDRYPLRWWIVVGITLALSLAGALGGRRLVDSSLAWFAIPVAWVGLSRAFFGWFDRRQRERLLAQFPDALAMIVRSVRVGIPVQEAIRTVARERRNRPAPSSAGWSTRFRVGVTMDDAMNEMAAAVGSAGIPVLCHCACRCRTRPAAH